MSERQDQLIGYAEDVLDVSSTERYESDIWIREHEEDIVVEHRDFGRAVYDDLDQLTEDIEEGIGAVFPSAAEVVGYFEDEDYVVQNIENPETELKSDNPVSLEQMR